jgi:hypothetical protein
LSKRDGERQTNKQNRMALVVEQVSWNVFLIKWDIFLLFKTKNWKQNEESYPRLIEIYDAWKV